MPGSEASAAACHGAAQVPETPLIPGSSWDPGPFPVRVTRVRAPQWQQPMYNIVWRHWHTGSVAAAARATAAPAEARTGQLQVQALAYPGPALIVTVTQAAGSEMLSGTGRWKSVADVPSTWLGSPLARA